MLFVRTLVGNAFRWFERLPKGSIQSFQDLQAIFTMQLQAKTPPVMLKVLLETHQEKDESMEAYLNRWSNLSMQCWESNQKTVFDICMRNLDQVSKIFCNCEAHLLRTNI